MSLIRSFWRWLNTGDGEYVRAPGGVYRWVRQTNLKALMPWAYLAIGLYTFGYSATHYPVEEKTGYSTPTPNDIPGVKPGFAGIFWPLFWTWELMDSEDRTCS